MFKINLSIMFMLLMVLSACKKNKLDTDYKDVDRLGIGSTTDTRSSLDSVGYSFATSPTGTTQNNVMVYAQLMGEVSDADRAFSVEVDPASTALPSEYTLPSTFVLKAGSISAGIPVTLKRTARLENTSVQLILKIKSNNNFQPAERQSVRVVWTDELTMPDVWLNYEFQYWGTYSKAKYRLMLEATEIKSFTFNLSFEDVIYISTNAKRSLDQYNAAHPGNQLLNDQGFPLDICGNCQ